MPKLLVMLSWQCLSKIWKYIGASSLVNILLNPTRTRVCDQLVSTTLFDTVKVVCCNHAKVAVHLQGMEAYDIRALAEALEVIPQPWQRMRASIPLDLCASLSHTSLALRLQCRVA